MPENEEDIPPIETEPTPDETSFEQRLENRLAELERRLSECESRIGEHGHDGYSTAEHSHEQYSLGEHTHESKEEIREEDNNPQPTHVYFRKVGD